MNMIARDGNTYNDLFEFNPGADALLAIIGLNRDSFGRFRDAYCRTSPDGSPRISIFTKNGTKGWMEAEHRAFVNSNVTTAHPYYVSHADDSDPVYATYHYRVPSGFEKNYHEIREAFDHTPPLIKLHDFLVEFQRGGKDPKWSKQWERLEKIKAEMAKKLGGVFNGA